MDNNSLAHTKWNCKYHIVFFRLTGDCAGAIVSLESVCMSRPGKELKSMIVRKVVTS